MTIGSVMLLTLFNLFKTQKETYGSEGLLTEAEQSVRAATDFITRKLRMAGYKLPTIKTTLTANYSSGMILNVASTSGFDNSNPIYISGGGNFDSAAISSMDTARFNIGASLSSSYSAGDTVYQYLAGEPSITAASDSSITFYSYYGNVSTTLKSNYTGASDTFLTVNNTNDEVKKFKNNGWIVISDDFNTEWGTVNGDSVNPTINIDSAFTNEYAIGDTVYDIDYITLSFDSADKQMKRDLNNGGGAQPIADNIDYFRYRFYDENDTLITAPDSETDPVAAVTARARIRKINIQVVAITSKDDTKLTANLSGTYDDGSTYSDKRHRVSLETDIFVRTLVP